MSSSYSKELKKVNQLIIHGQLKEALEIIDDSTKKKDINKEEKLQFLAFKSELEFYFGNFDKSIKLADKILKESKEMADPLLTCDACTWKAVSSFYFGETSSCLEVFEEGLKTIESVKNLPLKAVTKRKARLQVWYSLVIIHLAGDFNKGLALSKEALSIAEKNDHKSITCLSLILLVECYTKLHDTNRNKELVEKAHTIATELGNKFLMAFSYGQLTRAHGWIRESEKVEESFKKALSLAEEIGTRLLFFYKNDFGNFYRYNFQFDKAIKFYLEALEVIPILRNMTNTNLAYAYYMKYDFEQARKHYLLSMKYSEETKDYYILPHTLSGLVKIAVEINNLEEAKEYLKRLEELKEETGFEKIDQMYRYSSFLILKASGSISDLAKAAELLDNLLAEERILVMGRLGILYSLLEIRMKELQLSPSEENLKEVRKRLFHLEVEAENGQYQWFLANVYRLQSQLAIVELDINEAINLLDKAQKIAEEIDLELLKNEIKRDREKINHQLSILQKFQEQKAPLNEALKLVSLENSVKSVKRETVFEERDQETGEVIEYRKLFSIQL
ncbi:MAG: tetratricopeptide repeat protein [Candidatus Heimdallarchaeota archaeon]